MKGFIGFMAVIKNAQSGGALKDAVVLDMGDLGRQAERLLASARSQAATIVQSASAKAREMIESADQRGYAAGLQRGSAEGRQAGHLQGRQEAIEQFTSQLEQLTKSFTAALGQWETDRSAMFHQAREDVIRFACAVGQRVVHRLIKVDPTIIRDQLAAAMALLSKPTALEISINPEDRALVEQVLPELLATVARCEHATIREDASIGQGGCIIRNAAGYVDATIPTQLERIAEALAPGTSDEQPPVCGHSHEASGR